MNEKIKELKKNNYKKKIVFTILFTILVILRQYLTNLLPISIGSIIVPILTIGITSMIGLKILFNLARAIKYRIKIKKANDKELEKILVDKYDDSLKSILYITLLTEMVWLRTYAASFFQAKIAIVISPLSTLVAISLIISSVVLNSVNMIYSRKEINEVMDDETKMDKNNTKTNKKQKLLLLKKELEIYDNQLKNGNIEAEEQKENVRILKK